MAVPLPAPRPQPLPQGQRERMILRVLRRPAERPARRLLTRLHPADIARLAPLLTPDEQGELWSTLLEMRLAARTLRELDGETRQGVLARLGDEQLAAIVGRLSADDAVDLLRELDEERRASTLGRLDPGRAADPRLAVVRIDAEVVAGEDVLEDALDAALEAGRRRLATARPGEQA